MDGPREVILSEISLIEKDKYCIVLLICKSKNDINELICKIETSLYIFNNRNYVLRKKLTFVV